MVDGREGEGGWGGGGERKGARLGPRYQCHVKLPLGLLRAQLTKTHLQVITCRMRSSVSYVVRALALLSRVTEERSSVSR